ncbi:PIG-L deacetylase family protein [Quadrisphaera granulorum]|uniref:PIG-L deacetylase family protein n=1 Tax=Quadrisphaera granulorum TaxID=317664 RepID=UPI001B85BBAD|nr:PIG-L deacetylase family protein [Quadrisphaera granulorum]
MSDAASSTSAPLPALPEDFDRVLCIVAHPDDVEYGTAAAVARWTAAGKQVVYAMATSGEAGIDTIPPATAGPLREAEELASAGAVGVREVEFFRHRDGRLTESIDLRLDIARAIRQHRPHLVVTLNHHDTWGPGTWNSADHRALGRTVLDGVADAANRWIFPELGHEGFAPWKGVRRVVVANSTSPTHVVDITNTVEAGIAALALHEEYFRALDPDTPVRRQAEQVYERVVRRDAPGWTGRSVLAVQLALAL